METSAPSAQSGRVSPLLSDQDKGKCFRGLPPVVAQLVKNPPAVRETGLQRSPGEGKGHPLQYSGLENYSPWGHKESHATE